MALATDATGVTAGSGAGGAGMVLRRKAAGGRPPPPPEPGEPPAIKALRRGLPRAAEAECGLPLIVRDLRLQDAALAELLERLEQHALLAVLEGPGDRLGLMMLAPEVMAALIERQTTGAVLSEPAAPRRPTRTDAAMCAGFIDRTMAELELGLQGAVPGGRDGAMRWAGGYRYASFLDDPRPLGLLLEDVAYRIFRLSVDVVGVERRGAVLIALPVEEARARAPGSDGAGAPQGSDAAPGAAPPADAADPGWQDRLEHAVLSSPAVLEGVLCRMKLPLSGVLGWREGDLLMLPGAGLGAVTLAGPGGRRLAGGRLGQCHGQRALRLQDPADADSAGFAGVEGGGLRTSAPELDFPALSPLPDLPGAEAD